MVEFDKINPNLSKLSAHIRERTRAFFDANGVPNMKYFEEVHCYQCNKDTFTREFYDRYGFRHLHCDTCGMVYVSPRLKKDIAHGLYSEEEYVQHYKIKLLPSLDYRRNILGVNKYNQIVNALGKDKGRVLDIGCGLGEVLSVFKDKEWETLGIEFNPFASNYTRETFGIPVVNKSVYDFNEEDKFDVIMLWGVLEHLYDPSRILDKCRKILSEDSLLVIEVPSSDSLLLKYVENTGRKVNRIIEGDRHLMLFSVASLKGMLEKSGFECQKLLSNGLDMATLNKLFLKSALSDKSLNAVQEVLDDAMQGDLLRGFFNKKV